MMMDHCCVNQLNERALSMAPIAFDLRWLSASLLLLGCLFFAADPRGPASQKTILGHFLPEGWNDRQTHTWLYALFALLHVSSVVFILLRSTGVAPSVAPSLSSRLFVPASAPPKDRPGGGDMSLSCPKCGALRSQPPHNTRKEREFKNHIMHCRGEGVEGGDIRDTALSKSKRASKSLSLATEDVRVVAVEAEPVVEPSETSVFEPVPAPSSASSSSGPVASSPPALDAAAAAVQPPPSSSSSGAPTSPSPPVADAPAGAVGVNGVLLDDPTAFWAEWTMQHKLCKKDAKGCNCFEGMGSVM